MPAKLRKPSATIQDILAVREAAMEHREKNGSSSITDAQILEEELHVANEALGVSGQIVAFPYRRGLRMMLVIDQDGSPVEREQG